MRPHELIVISDREPALQLPSVIAGLSVKSIDWADVRGYSVANASLFIDLDLRDIAKVKSVKDNLPVRAADHCRIIAVERGSHQSEAQANGLGASHLLKRPIELDELIASVVSHVKKQERGEASCRFKVVPENEDGAASINSGAVALDGIFSALRCANPLYMHQIEQAGDLIVDAVGGVGLSGWLNTVRRYHEGTFQHCLLVTGVATSFGNRTGMRRQDILTLTMAGLLHDIGKAQIPIEILDKPGRLTDEEFATIKTHTTIGYDYLKAQSNIPSDVMSTVRHHHEYLDGSGYPDGLHGSEIGDVCRIMTVCDVYGALVERRAYKEPKSPQAAMSILLGLATNGKVELDLVRALQRGLNL